MRERFGAPVQVFPVWGGTGANVVALACLTRASDAVVCSDERTHPCRRSRRARAHGRHQADRAPDARRQAPTGAAASAHAARGWATSTTRSRRCCRSRSRPSRARCTPPTRSARSATTRTGPACSSISTGRASRTPTAALGGDLRSFTIDAGVDVISFGGTKNGMMYGEAVVFCRPELADNAQVRAQAARAAAVEGAVHLRAVPRAARGRSVAASSRRMRTRWPRARDARLAEVAGRRARRSRPVVNSVFATLPAGRDRRAAEVVLLLHLGRAARTRSGG